MTDKSKIIEILENFWPKNKAKGLLAQAIFSKKIKTNSFGKDAKDKIIPGCWLLAPKGSDFYKFRFCFFVHPVVVKTDKIRNVPYRFVKPPYRNNNFYRKKFCS